VIAEKFISLINKNNMVYKFSDVVIDSLFRLYQQMVGTLPDILGALVVILLGLMIAPIIGGIVKKLIDITKVDAFAEKIGLFDALEGYFKKPSLAIFFGKLVKWFFVLAFLMAAVEILGWTQVGDFIKEIVFYIPQIFIASAIIIIGVLAGKLVSEVIVRSIEGSKAPINHPELLGKFAKYSIVGFAVLTALHQLNIAGRLIEILFAGIVAALALAFGLGAKEKVGKLLDYLDGTK